MSENRAGREAAARARMAELATKFLERTLGELGAMREGVAKLSAGNAHSLDDIRHLAHRMSGTGATLGFETLSDCALRIEQFVETQVPGSLPGAIAMLQLDTAIDALEVELGRLKGS